MTAAPGRTRTYAVRTLGCQMNVHDSERMAGLLEQAGYVEAADADRADLIVINTCAVRENADNRLYGNLGRLAARKRENPDLRIAVAGCLAQKDRGAVLDRAPWVDVVLGTHNIDALPVLLQRADRMGESQSEFAETLQAFPSDLPVVRGSAHSAWVSTSVGCNNTCTFCIVPSLRGRQRDRRAGEILAEVSALADQGVREVTLLGQNVNAYGVEFGERGAFAALLRQVGAVPGVRRVRFTSPHPRDFTPDVIEAMAQTPTVMPHLHMPLQSGSDDVLRRMRRSYRAEKYLGIIDAVREAIPDAAITTDIIVGFPGETDSDFEATLDVVAQAQFADAFTFQYSPRPGTPAADYPDQVPAPVVSERYSRLAELVSAVSWEQNRKLEGRELEVMVAEAAGRKDGQTRRLTGRSRGNRLVHFAAPDQEVAPGDLVAARIDRGAPHHLLSDTPATVLERSASAPGCAPAGGSGPAVALGLPSMPRSG